MVITGGAGFIGSNLARELVDKGAPVRIVDNLERGQIANLHKIKDRVEFIQADLRSHHAVLDALRGADVVFHLAAQVGGIKVYTDKAGSVLNNNLLIDQQMLAAVIQLKIPHLFYASSAHVYPRHLQQRPDAPALREQDADPADPVLTYGWGKRIGEIAALSLAAENPWMKISIARIMGAFGYNQDIALETGSIIPVFCHRAIVWPEGAPFRLWGTGRETRSYVFIDDVVEAILCSIETLARHRIIGPFNLAAEGCITVRRIAEMIIDISGKTIPLEYNPAMPTAIWGQAADCTLAQQVLGGWKAQVDLATGLQRTYRHIEQRIRSIV